MLLNGSSLNSSTILPVIAGSLGLILMGLNLYGEATGMRAAELIPEAELRFDNDVSMSYTEALEALERSSQESDKIYAIRVNGVVQRSMAHIRSWHGHPPDLFRQRVPFTENPYLHMVGRLPGLPQFERYHFANYRKSLERGIGLCGDHTLILSQVLDIAGIENSLLSFRGHVLAEVEFDDGSSAILDPDFGVVVHADRKIFEQNPALISTAYRQAGYSEREIDSLQNGFVRGFTQFDSAYSFMRMRWWFEHISYIAKWILPLVLMGYALLMYVLNRRQADTSPSHDTRFGSPRSENPSN